MRIALINTKRTVRARYILECFSAGAAKLGDKCVWVEGAQHAGRLKDVDLGVFICLPNFHHTGDPINHFRVDAWNRLKKAKKRALVVDTGFVNNQYDYELLCKLNPKKHRFDVGKSATFQATDSVIHYELAFEGIKGLGDHVTEKAQPSDRWSNLRTPLLPWKKEGKSVVFLTQPLHGQSSQDCDIFAWYGGVFAELKEAGSKLPLIARMHPRVGRAGVSHRQTKEYRKNVEARLQPGQLLDWSASPKLDVVLADADLAVVYSTSAGVNAVCSGVPLLVGSSACMAFPVASATLSEALGRRINHNYADRQPWANALAYSQWTCGEIRNGAAWRHYKPHALSERKGRY